MKRVFALMLVLVLAFAAVGCGGASSGAEKKEEEKKEEAAPAEEAAEEEAAEPAADGKIYDGVKLRFTTAVFIDEATDKAVWDQVIADFKEETGAEVELIQLGYGDLITTEMSNLIAGDAADILFFGGGSEYDFYANGYLAELDDLLTDEDVADWMYYDGKMIDGKHYLVPYVGGACMRGVFVNLDIANELGLEMPAHDGLTWDILTEYSQKAIENGYGGFYTPFSGNENAIISNYFNYVCEAGGSLTNDKGEWDFTSDAALDAMKFIYDMGNTNKIINTVSYDSDAANAGWANGEALFVVANCATINEYYINGDIPFEWDAYNLRYKTDAAFSTVDDWGINAASENKEAAVALLKFILQKDRYIQIMDKLDPTIFDNVLDGVEPDAFGKLADQVAGLMDYETPYWPPIAANSQQIKEALQTHQQLCASGDESPEDALAAIQAVVDSFK